MVISACLAETKPSAGQLMSQLARPMEIIGPGFVVEEGGVVVGEVGVGWEEHQPLRTAGGGALGVEAEGRAFEPRAADQDQLGAAGRERGAGGGGDRSGGAGELVAARSAEA